MKDYISTLQSQIARNSFEIRNTEFLVFNEKLTLKRTENFYVRECINNADDFRSHEYLSNILMQLQEDRKHYLHVKKTLKKLVENQKTLKKLKTQLVIIDNLHTMLGVGNETN